MTVVAPIAGETLALPSCLDLSSAAALARDLTARRGAALRLDASAVERVGGLGLQVLLSARLTWRNDGVGFAVVDPSEAFRADCAQLGVSAIDDFNEDHRG